MTNYSLSENTSQNGTANELSIPSTSTYTISVYASKPGYENSKTVTKYITLSVGKKGDVNGDGKVSITDAVSVVNIILNQGNENADPSRVVKGEEEKATDPK